jgi:hypothetical protein
MPAEVRDLSLVKNGQAISTAHTTPYCTGAGDVFPEAEMLTTYLHLLAKLRISGDLHLKLYL